MRRDCPRFRPVYSYSNAPREAVANAAKPIIIGRLVSTENGFWTLLLHVFLKTSIKLREDAPKLVISGTKNDFSGEGPIPICPRPPLVKS